MTIAQAAIRVALNDATGAPVPTGLSLQIRLPYLSLVDLTMQPWVLAPFGGVS